MSNSLQLYIDSELSLNPEVVSETNKGEPLTVAESKFISYFVETGSALDAYYRSNTTFKGRAAIGSEDQRGEREAIKYAAKAGKSLLKKRKIADEIAYRIEKIKGKTIASADEILSYFTAVMRGEVLDQFGLEASLQERTKAAEALCKRIIDAPRKEAQLNKLGDIQSQPINIIVEGRKKFVEAEFEED